MYRSEAARLTTNTPFIHSLTQSLLIIKANKLTIVPVSIKRVDSYRVTTAPFFYMGPFYLDIADSCGVWHSMHVETVCTYSYVLMDSTLPPESVEHTVSCFGEPFTRSSHEPRVMTTGYCSKNAVALRGPRYMLAL